MLDVSHLSISFNRYGKGFSRHSLSPVTDISLQVNAGEIVAVIGSSGSGKSLLAHAILGLLPQNAQTGGILSFKGRELTEKRIQTLRGKEIALIPQSVGYLNPLAQVGKQVYRSAQLCGIDAKTASHSVNSTFARYHLANFVQSMFPFQISGGMARRVLTATATVGKADLIIADEPTTGLDPAAAEKSLHHLVELAQEGKGILLITHDLAAAIRVAKKVVVIYAGETVEITNTKCFFNNHGLLHPYTRALWQALPQNGFSPLIGSQPFGDEVPSGCIFSPRCPIAQETCLAAIPELAKINGSMVRCLHAQS